MVTSQRDYPLSLERIPIAKARRDDVTSVLTQREREELRSYNLVAGRCRAWCAERGPTWISTGRTTAALR